MSLTSTEIDAFARFARAEADNGHAPASLEECLARWRAADGPRPFTLPPYPNGKTLKEVLEEAGLLGLDDDGPEDLASNPAYMDGLGQDGGRA